MASGAHPGAVRTTISRTLWFALAGALLLAGVAAAATLETDTDVEGNAHVRLRWAPHPAPFHEDANGSVQGKFVSFRADAASGTLTDYTLVRDVGSRALFASVRLDAGASSYDEKVKGPGYAMRGGNATLVAFDAPNAGLDVLARDGATLTLVAAEGVLVEKHEGDPGWSPEGALLKVGNATARLVVRNGHLNVTGQTITVTLGPEGKMEVALEGHPAQRMAEHRALERAPPQREGRPGRA